jgi:prolyl-tRNA editing enzyme YbaK/EbsC (Cys-tRNA(Pro) deacylase)
MEPSRGTIGVGAGVLKVAVSSETKGREVVEVSVMGAYLEFLGIPFEEIPHAKVSAALEAAAVASAAPAEVLETVVVHSHGGYALVVIPASRRVDMRAVREAVGDHQARFATERELERAFFYDLGAMPPLGSLVGAKTYVDPEVFVHETVVFAAGSQTESIRCRTADLFRSEPITVTTLTGARAAEPELVG